MPYIKFLLSLLVDKSVKFLRVSEEPLTELLSTSLLS